MKTSTKAVAAIVLTILLAGLVVCLQSQKYEKRVRDLMDRSSAVSVAETQIPIKDFSGMEAYKVVRIVDGDTVILLIHGEKTSVRLIGVDTPETVHPRKPVQYYGREAGCFLKNLLRGERVYIEHPYWIRFSENKIPGSNNEFLKIGTTNGLYYLLTLELG